MALFADLCLPAAPMQMYRRPVALGVPRLRGIGL